MVFDLFKKESFTNLDNWLKEVDKNAWKEVQIIVLANKYDLIEQTNPNQSRAESGGEEPSVAEERGHVRGTN